MSRKQDEQYGVEVTILVEEDRLKIWVSLGYKKAGSPDEKALLHCSSCLL